MLVVASSWNLKLSSYTPWRNQISSSKLLFSTRRRRSDQTFGQNLCPRTWGHEPTLAGHFPVTNCYLQLCRGAYRIICGINSVGSLVSPFPSWINASSSSSRLRMALVFLLYVLVTTSASRWKSHLGSTKRRSFNWQAGSSIWTSTPGRHQK